MPIDTSAASTVKAPPRRGRPPGKAATPSVSVDTRTLTEKRVEGLQGLGQLIQLACVATGQYADAATVGMHFDPLAKATADLADEYDSVAKPIDFLIQMGPFSALIAAATPMVLQLLANHKVVDASRLMGQGVVPPEVLESQMRASIAQMQAQAMRAQQEALEEARKSEAEMNAYLAEVSKESAEKAE